jgi:hypothetical protein
MTVGMNHSRQRLLRNVKQILYSARIRNIQHSKQRNREVAAPGNPDGLGPVQNIPYMFAEPPMVPT